MENTIIFPSFDKKFLNQAKMKFIYLYVVPVSCKKKN